MTFTQRAWSHITRLYLEYLDLNQICTKCRQAKTTKDFYYIAKLNRHEKVCKECRRLASRENYRKRVENKLKSTPCVSDLSA